MLAQLGQWLKVVWRWLRPRLAAAWRVVLAELGELWRLVKPAIFFVLQVLAALFVLFEEWGWQPLMSLLGRLARFRLWAALELWIAGLPPYGALVVFALPTTLLLPLKFLAVYLLAEGMYWTATLLFVGAKIVSTAFIARIFLLTQPALMQIPWFARAYNWFMPWKEHLFEIIRASWVWRYGRMVKTRVRLAMGRAWIRWKPSLEAAWRTWGVNIREALLRARVAMREAWRRWKPRIVAQAQATRDAVRSAWGRWSGTA